jgi:heme/copper-type cytochrome/quinol oxidase subunit 3
MNRFQIVRRILLPIATMTLILAGLLWGIAETYNYSGSIWVSYIKTASLALLGFTMFLGLGYTVVEVAEWADKNLWD